MITITKCFGKEKKLDILCTREVCIEEDKSISSKIICILLNISRKNVDKTHERMWVEIEDIPESVVYDRDKLIEIEFPGHRTIKKGSDLKNIRLTQYTNAYQIVFNHDALSDCSDTGMSEFTFTFSIKSKAKRDSEIQSISLPVEVKLQKAIPKSDYTFKFASEKGIDFKKEKTKLGDFIIENKCAFKYAEYLSVEVSLQLLINKNENIVSWCDLKKIKESYSYCGVGSCLDPTISEAGLSLNKIVAQNEVTIPVYIDMSKLSNPIDSFREYSLITTITNLITGQSVTGKYDFKVLKDTQRTQLLVLVNGNKLKHGDDSYVGKYKWIEFKSDSRPKYTRYTGKAEVLNLKISNLAENIGGYTNAAVSIKNIKIELSNKGGGFSMLNDVNNIENAIQLRPISSPNLGVIELSNETPIILKNEKDSYISFIYDLCHSEIKDMPDNGINVNAHVKFDYNVIESNSKNTQGSFSAFTSFDIEKDPGTEWLCIDFGTSATVAAFGDSDNIRILNLDERSKSLLKTHHKDNNNPRFEENTPFLSSNTIFTELGGILEPEDFGQKFVFLSPSEPIFTGSKYILPYIKALVGAKSLPQTFDKSNLCYKKEVHGSDFSFSEHPLSVDEIFTATYRSLFNDYVIPSIGEDKDKVNKLIVSIPNTYTPKHIEFLKEIIERNFPKIRKEYIWFISESDAVACYYIEKWRNLNDTRNSDQRKKISDCEHILVYDMGAGTLDLTYLSIKKDGDYRKVEILAKYGLNKAGNYLDYILAKALQVTYENDFSETLVGLKSAKEAQKRERCLLKTFVKNELKPKLFDVGKAEISYIKDDKSKVKINLEKIREHEYLKEFIEDCTEKLLNNFFTINGLSVKNNIIPIDTVILTGRSVQFGSKEKGIKHSLMEAIGKLNGGQECHQISIKGTELKTIVSNGALYFATIYGREGSLVKLINKNIYASYGVIYTDINGHIAYKELLSPKTKATKEPDLNNNSTNGVYIYQYDTNVHCADGDKCAFLDLRRCSMAYFIQTYSVNTAEDWDKGTREFITVMFQFAPESMVSNSDLTKVPIRIVVNERNEMFTYVGVNINEAMAPVVIDIENNESFRRSMWPYL